MRKLRHVLLLCAGLIGTQAYGQTESTLYFMNSLPQVVEVNPSIMPRYKLSIGLPFISSVGGMYANNGFTYNDMITRTNGTVQADLTKLTSGLAEKNYVTGAVQTDLFRFGMRVSPKFYVMFNSSIKVYNRTRVDKGLVSLFVDGTAPLVGTFLNTSPQDEGLSYLETSGGLAYKVNDQLTIGARVKYLKGIMNFTTDYSSLIVQVGNNYAITATGDASFRSSGINNLNTSGYEIGDHISDYTKNTGLGMDLGITYKFMEKLTLGASLIDLGYINWKNDTHQYSLDPATATYTFTGLDITQVINHNDNYLQSQFDLAKEKFTVKENATGSYTTVLPTKIYLSGKYELNPSLSIGALFFSEKFRDRYSAGMTAAVNKNFGRVISTSFSYTASNRSYNNIGAGVSFNLSPIQIYIVGDNLLRAPVALIADKNINSYVNSSQLINVRAGLNLVFGWDKGITKKAAETKDESHNPREKVSSSKVKNTYGRSPQKKKKTKKSSGKAKPPASKVGR